MVLQSPLRKALERTFFYLAETRTFLLFALTAPHPRFPASSSRRRAPPLPAKQLRPSGDPARLGLDGPRRARTPYTFRR